MPKKIDENVVEVENQKKEVIQTEKSLSLQPEMPTAKKETSVLYIGPSLNNEMIAHATAFSSMPDLTSLENKYPGIRVFFIESDKISTSLNELSKTGSELNIRYQEIQKIERKGVK